MIDRGPAEKKPFFSRRFELTNFSRKIYLKVVLLTCNQSLRPLYFLTFIILTIRYRRGRAYNEEMGVYLPLLVKNGQNIAKTDFRGPKIPPRGASSTLNM